MRRIRRSFEPRINRKQVKINKKNKNYASLSAGKSDLGLWNDDQDSYTKSTSRCENLYTSVYPQQHRKECLVLVRNTKATRKFQRYVLLQSARRSISNTEYGFGKYIHTIIYKTTLSDGKKRFVTQFEIAPPFSVVVYSPCGNIVNK